MNEMTKPKEFCLWYVANDVHELQRILSQEVPEWVQMNIAYSANNEILVDDLKQADLESLHLFSPKEMKEPDFALDLRDIAFEEYVATMVVDADVRVPEVTWGTIENILYDTASTGYVVIPTWSNPDGIFEGPPQIRKMWQLEDRMMGAIEEPQILFSLYGDINELPEEKWKWHLLSKLGISGPWREIHPYTLNKMSQYAGKIPVVGYVERTGEK